MIDSRNNSWGIGGMDWTTVLIYLLLVFMGWFNIYAAVYDPSHASIFDIEQRYGMQLIWIGASLFIALTIMLLDDKYYHVLSYPLYWVAIIVLIAVSFIGKEVNGAKSWIVLGPVALQPTEFVKFTTALALARYMSKYTFSINNFRDLLMIALILGLPFMVIIFQNDTGSALVYGAFLFVLYREGFSGWVYLGLIMALMLFIFSFLFTPVTLLILLIMVCIVAEGLVNGRWRDKIIFLSGLALGSIILYFGFNLVFTNHISVHAAVLATALVSIIAVVIYSYRHRLRNVYIYIGLFVGSLLFTSAIDYVFDNVLQVHQQKRILDLLGLETDLKGWGYNVNQSKIAIGSGGLFGKGFLDGTQTKYNFVPEQSTDFIFCTVGEEWGFVGSVIIVALFCILILRLMRMGERQQEPFGRIYCYSVAAIFLFHVVINIGMTIGIMPVIGIPLPFFSYGGSSLIAFTILFFVAVKMDAVKGEMIINR